MIVPIEVLARFSPTTFAQAVKLSLFPLACLFLSVLMSACVPAADENSVTKGIVVSNVTIVDTRDGTLTPNMAVVIDGDEIVKIAATDMVSASGSATVVDATGKFVIPGLMDMHAHTLSSETSDQTFSVMLAHGITGFRELGASPELHMKRANGTLMPPDAPELLELAGSLGGPDSREGATERVQELAALGADFIKISSGSPDVYLATIEEAERQGIYVDGHIVPMFSPWDAARAGMRVIEHLGPFTALLLGCSTEEDALRRELAERGPMPGPVQDNGANTQELFARYSASPLMNNNPNELAILPRVIDTYSEERCRDLADEFVEHGTWHNLTLIRLHTMQFADDPRYRNNRLLGAVSEATRKLWEEEAEKFPGPLARDTMAEFFELQLRVTKLFEETGVKLLAGSDVGGGWVLPGLGFHQELDLLEVAGITPLRVLQMATWDGAVFLGRETTMGSVDEGKIADLVLLNSNPIESVQHLHRIHGVIHDGKYYDRRTLDDMIAQAIEG